MTRILDCGHEPTPSTSSLGYGKDAQGKTYCYECCAERDRADMRETGKAMLYLTMRGDTTLHELINWPGSLRIPVWYIRKGRHNMAGVRYDFQFMFEGQKWHGTQYGDNTQIAHCKRMKGQGRG